MGRHGGPGEKHEARIQNLTSQTTEESFRTFRCGEEFATPPERLAPRRPGSDRYQFAGNGNPTEKDLHTGRKT